MSAFAPVVLCLALGPIAQESVDHSAFDAILRANVRDQKVDYLTIRRDHHAQLKSYLDALAAVDPGKLSKTALLTAQINLYNATMIHAVITRYRDGFSPADDEYAIFGEPLVRFADETFSLNALENEKIRPVFKEPRIHVALVCAARSCPPLLARAYPEDQLGDVLEDNMFRFVRDVRRNPIDVEGRRLVLSKIFEWYAADFGGPEKVPAYVARYHPRKVADFPVSFAEYDWTLNIAAPRSGRWVVLTRPAALATGGEDAPDLALRKGEVFEVLGEGEGEEGGAEGWLRVDRGLGRGETRVQSSLVAEWTLPR